MKIYTGIGSREAPADVLALMTRIAAAASEDGWTLRSGHAPGADQAFEAGAGTQAEIYLPWRTFESHVPIHAAYVQAKPSIEAEALAMSFHPVVQARGAAGWAALGPGVRALLSRNSHQILGSDLQTPAKLVICWTPGGADVGGTAQAIRIARDCLIPIFNLALPEVRVQVENAFLARRSS